MMQLGAVRDHILKQLDAAKRDVDEKKAVLQAFEDVLRVVDREFYGEAD